MSLVVFDESTLPPQRVHIPPSFRATENAMRGAFARLVAGRNVQEVEANEYTHFTTNATLAGGLRAVSKTLRVLRLHLTGGYDAFEALADDAQRDLCAAITSLHELREYGGRFRGPGFIDALVVLPHLQLVKFGCVVGAADLMMMVNAPALRALTCVLPDTTYELSMGIMDALVVIVLKAPKLEALIINGFYDTWHTRDWTPLADAYARRPGEFILDEGNDTSTNRYGYSRPKRLVDADALRAAAIPMMAFACAGAVSATTMSAKETPAARFVHRDGDLALQRRVFNMIYYKA